MTECHRRPGAKNDWASTISGNNMLRMRVFPVPAKGDQKVAFTYESVAEKESGLVEYMYPLKTDGKATATLEKFGITATVKSQHGVQNVYSPTHALAIKRVNDREVAVEFERNQGLLDKDFHMFYSFVCSRIRENSVRPV